jgi:hypothetical protein
MERRASGSPQSLAASIIHSDTRPMWLRGRVHDVACNSSAPRSLGWQQAGNLLPAFNAFCRDGGLLVPKFSLCQGPAPGWAEGIRVWV